MLELVLAACVFLILFGGIGSIEVARNRRAGRSDSSGLKVLAVQLAVIYAVLGAMLAVFGNAPDPSAPPSESPRAGVDYGDPMVGP